MLNVMREPVATRMPEAVMTAPPVALQELSEPTPFIEIGGPNGTVSSWLPVAAPKITDTPKPVREPEIVPFPRITPSESSFVSVAFHELSAKAKSEPRSEGPGIDLVAFHSPDHPVSLEYRALRDEIGLQLPDVVPHALLFTAAASDSGTTAVVLNLAATLAREGKSRVLVVDANVNRPAVSARLGVKDSPGLAEALTGHIPLAWTIQATTIPNLQVLAAGLATSETSATFTDELPKLLAQLRQWYDWVLIDGGVWGEIPERDAACPGADAVYLVTRETSVNRAEFEGLRGWVRELGGLLRGFVTTRV
jgi:Mrp family chromosome partitioning ATPase